MKDEHKYLADPKELLDDATISKDITLTFARPQDAKAYRRRLYYAKDVEMRRSGDMFDDDHPYSALVFALDGATLTVMNTAHPKFKSPIMKVVKE